MSKVNADQESDAGIEIKVPQSFGHSIQCDGFPGS